MFIHSITRANITLVPKAGVPIYVELHLKIRPGTSMVVYSIKIHLPMQEIWVQSLAQEDFTRHGATKPVYHNY